MIRKTIFKTGLALTAALGLATAAQAGGNVTIQSTIQGSPSYAPASTFDVEVEVVGNDVGTTPGAIAMRVTYNSTLFSLTDISGGDSSDFADDDGPVGIVDLSTLGPEETVSGSTVSRDILSQGNIGPGGNTDFTPMLFTMRFMVDSDAFLAVPTGASITVESDPDAASGITSTEAAPFSGFTLIYENSSITEFPTWSDVADWTLLD